MSRDEENKKTDYEAPQSHSLSDDLEDVSGGTSCNPGPVAWRPDNSNDCRKGGTAAGMCWTGDSAKQACNDGGHANPICMSGGTTTDGCRTGGRTRECDTGSSK
jgi:hypothetical protein